MREAADHNRSNCPAPEFTESTGSPDGDAHRLRNGLIWTGALALLLLGIGLAVPDLRSILGRAADAKAGWLVLGVALEIASCLGYVAVVRLVLHRAPTREARRLAWAEMAFGAVVPVGGAGGLAVGAWAMRAWGIAWSRIVNRSMVIFLLTSAVNAAVLGLAGLGVWVGLGSGQTRRRLRPDPGGADDPGARVLHDAAAVQRPATDAADAAARSGDRQAGRLDPGHGGDRVPAEPSRSRCDRLSPVRHRRAVGVPARRRRVGPDPGRRGRLSGRVPGEPGSDPGRARRPRGRPPRRARSCTDCPRRLRRRPSSSTTPSRCGYRRSAERTDSLGCAAASRRRPVCRSFPARHSRSRLRTPARATGRLTAPASARAPGRYVGRNLTGIVFSWLMNGDSANTGRPASSIAG